MVKSQRKQNERQTKIQSRRKTKMTWRNSERCWRATTRCPLSKRCRGLISTLRIRCSRFHAYLNFVSICMILTTLLLLLEILCCEMCCCGPKTSKPVRATFIVTLMFHLHPNFELINHLYLLLPMRTTDKFNNVIQKSKQTRNILPACYTWWRQRLRFTWLFYGLGPFRARQYVSSVIDTNAHCIPHFFVKCTWMLHVIQQFQWIYG